MPKSQPKKGRTVGPRAFNSAMRGVPLHVYCIHVSKPTPWSVAGPHGQLASSLFQTFSTKKTCVWSRN